MTDAARSLPDATRLALDRTRLAYDRTLLAWVRTSTSLISFGFSVHKFFQYMQESKQVTPGGWFGPRHFALVMISIGVLVLVIATLEHRIQIKSLRAEYGRVPYSLATLLAALIAGLGLLGLAAVIFA